MGKELTMKDLSEENASLKSQITSQEHTIINLVDRNNELAEFIRVKMSDILSLAKDFRDTYAHYAEFVSQMSKAAQEQIGGIDNAGENKEAPLRLDKS